jgi:hypothetical protein
MGKRSNFERVEKDFYKTPPVAVLPLIPFLIQGSSYAEPCAGDWDLIYALKKHGFHCTYAGDIRDGRDAFDWVDGGEADYIVTNPPWTRNVLHDLIVHFSDQLPTWLLFDADWVHTKQSIPFLPRLRTIVSVGRVKWFWDSKQTGKDNVAWYEFDKPDPDYQTKFYGRREI